MHLLLEPAGSFFNLSGSSSLRPPHERDLKAPRGTLRYHVGLRVYTLRGVFSRTQLFFTNLHSTAHTAYHTNPQHLATARLAQGKLWSKYESCAAVPHHLTVAWHSRRAARLLRQGVDCTNARPTTYRPHGLGQQRRYHERLVRALLASAHRVGACLEKRIVEGPAGARRRREL